MPKKHIRLSVFINFLIGIVFIVAAVIIVITVNHNMRQQALIEAQSKARIILDRNLATHMYFSNILKPSIFAWSEPFRTKDYFDHTWMSSTFAIREIEKYFKSLNPSGYYFRDAAINARSPENEADEYERAFIERLNADDKLEFESTVRHINGKPYLVVLKKGEVMEASCLRCHSDPKKAPKGLTDYYGSKRSFYRIVGSTVSAVSLRIPLSEVYGAANKFSLKLSAMLLAVLACLFITQYLFYRRYLLEPLSIMRDKAYEIAKHEERIGEQIPEPFGKELYELSVAFNKMSVKILSDRDNLEQVIYERTEKLCKNEAFQRAIIASSPVAIFSIDLEGKVQTWNESSQRIFGWSAEEVLGEPLPIVPEDKRAEFELFYRRVLAGESFYGIELVRQRKGGVLLDVSLSATRIIDADGNIIGILGVIQDITSRKRAEKALLQEKRRFSVLTESAPFGMVLIDKEGRFLYINPRFKELFGYDIEDIPDGNTWFKKAYPDPEYRKTVISTWLEDFKQTKSGQKKARIFTLTCKDGEEKIVRFIPVQLETGEHVVSCDDITEQKRLEQKLYNMSLTDEITGLYNRRGFITLSEKQMKIAERTKKDMLLFFVDLDKMKQINDTLGHQEGDKALIDIASVLKEVFRESDIIGRIGGDEFAILAIDTTEDTKEVLMMRLHNTLEGFNTAEDRVYKLSLSIGVAHYNAEAPLTLDQLMAKADMLMYDEKRGKNGAANRKM